MKNPNFKTREELEETISNLQAKLQLTTKDNVHLYHQMCKYKEWFTSLVLMNILILLWIIVLYFKF